MKVYLPPFHLAHNPLEGHLSRSILTTLFSYKANSSTASLTVFPTISGILCSGLE